jgi:DNA repair exonuclease SbcCD ATPase subunit
MLLESIERILAAVGKDVGDMDYAINHLQDEVKRLQEEVGPIEGDRGHLGQGAEDLVKRNESAVPKVEAFRKYRAQMLEATRERFKIMRRLNVTYSRSLAKRVRGERGVTPDEFAQQRAFFIKEHEKQLDSIRDEAKVQVQEARHKLEWTMKEERATMKAKLESELAAAEERARALRESLEKTVTEKHNAKVRILEEQLASALDRLEKGDFNLLTNLQSKDEFIESLKQQKADLQHKFEEAEVQEKENFKELKRLRQSIATLTGVKEEAAKLCRTAEREKKQAQKRADQLNQVLLRYTPKLKKK